MLFSLQCKHDILVKTLSLNMLNVILSWQQEGVVQKVEEEPIVQSLGENKLRKGGTKGRGGLIGQRAGQ